MSNREIRKNEELVSVLENSLDELVSFYKENPLVSLFLFMSEVRKNKNDEAGSSLFLQGVNIIRKKGISSKDAENIREQIQKKFGIGNVSEAEAANITYVKRKEQIQALKESSAQFALNSTERFLVDEFFNILSLPMENQYVKPSGLRCYYDEKEGGDAEFRKDTKMITDIAEERCRNILHLFME